jgi:diaminopimelate epimerase
MRIEFLKMHGLGNDFMVFDATAHVGSEFLDSARLRALADRHTGVGFNQALILEAPKNPRSRIFYRVFNSDGSEVEQCGNGARCVAALMFARDPELGRDLDLESVGGIVRARVGADGLVSVNMGIPNFDPRSLPMEAAEEARVYSFEVEGRTMELSAVSIGNPHAVLVVPDVQTAEIERLGPALEYHPRFAHRTNVGFMEIVDRAHIRLRVHERGAGETLACGTGACGAVAVGRRRGLLDAEVRVDLPGGTATVAWEGTGRPIWLTGPAVTVFSGSIDL